MAVFVCAADETADQNPRGNFVYAGFSAPVDIWEGTFAAAWNERVLQGPPQIPYLHMTDIRSAKWQAKHGLTATEVSKRLDEASRVIRSTGALIPVAISVPEQEFIDLLRQPVRMVNSPQYRVTTLEADHLCFLYFALTQLHWIYDAYPDVERVDFWIERNDPITTNLGQYFADLPAALEFIGRPHLVPLVGELNLVGKDRIPAQVADMFGWHVRNDARHTLDNDGTRRYWRMLDGGTGKLTTRHGHKAKLDRPLLEKLATGFARRLANASSDHGAVGA
jgi:hypothetical protein